MENVWIAFGMGIMGQKTRFRTPYYPDGNFYMNGTLGPKKLWKPSVPIEDYAAQVGPPPGQDKPGDHQPFIA
jgi:hypothetical protein